MKKYKALLNSENEIIQFEQITNGHPSVILTEEKKEIIIHAIDMKTAIDNILDILGVIYYEV